MMLRSGGSSRSMPKAGSNIATFLCCSWHCLRLSCCESYGRCRLTGGPHGLDDSCKHSKAISSSVLQDKLSKPVEKVCGYNTRQRHVLAYHFIARRHEGLCQVF